MKIDIYTSYFLSCVAGGALLGAVGGPVGAIAGAIMGIILVALVIKMDKALEDGIGEIDLDVVEGEDFD